VGNITKGAEVKAHIALGGVLAAQSLLFVLAVNAVGPLR
jgi:hypothetical protein